MIINLANFKWYDSYFQKSGINIISHKFYKTQQVIKYKDQKCRVITKQIFKNGKVIIHCKEGLSLDEVF